MKWLPTCSLPDVALQYPSIFNNSLRQILPGGPEFSSVPVDLCVVFAPCKRKNSQDNDPLRPPWLSENEKEINGFLGNPNFETRCTHPSCLSWDYDINKYTCKLDYISTPPYVTYFGSISIHKKQLSIKNPSSLSSLLGCTGGPSAKRLLPQVELRVIRLRRLPWLVVRATAKLLLRADITTPWKRRHSGDGWFGDGNIFDKRSGLCLGFPIIYHFPKHRYNYIIIINNI